MNAMRIVLAVVALALAAKSLLVFLWPGRVRAVASWWIRMPGHFARILGWGLGVAGVTLTGLAVSLISDAVVSAALAIGVLLIAAGIAYQYPAVWQQVVKPFSESERPWALRVLAAVGLVAAAALLWIVLMSRHWH